MAGELGYGGGDLGVGGIGSHLVAHELTGTPDVSSVVLDEVSGRGVVDADALLGLAIYDAGVLDDTEVVVRVA